MEEAASCSNSPRTATSTTPMKQITAKPLIISLAEEMNPRRRNTMEDYSDCHNFGFAGNDRYAYIGVYDGHGGRDIVEYLEGHFTKNLTRELQYEMEQQKENSAGGFIDIPKVLKSTFLISDVHSRANNIMSSGATVACCFVDRCSPNKTIIYAANCGDARAVLNQRGKALRITTDHKADDPDEVARIQKAGGFVMRGRVLGILAVARALGDHELKDFVSGRPDISTTEVDEQQDTFFIVACDGVWDVMTDQEAVDFVLQYTGRIPKDKISQALVNEAIRRGSTDNISAVVSWFV